MAKHVSQRSTDGSAAPVPVSGIAELDSRIERLWRVLRTVLEESSATLLLATLSAKSLASGGRIPHAKSPASIPRCGRRTCFMKWKVTYGPDQSLKMPIASHI